MLNLMIFFVRGERSKDVEILAPPGRRAAPPGAPFGPAARTGAAGWMPAVAGGWRKGMDRRSVRHLPLTAQVVGAHLSGDVFIGLYPLLTDNTCHFVVADFDGPTAIEVPLVAWRPELEG